jgi:RNA polymerase I-specific transcription initiation factor RRN7
VEEYFPKTLAQRQAPVLTEVDHPEIEVTKRFSSPVPINTDENVLCTGEGYRIYHSDDILGYVPEEYQVVVKRAARWAGVDEEIVYAVIERFEMRFLRWWKNKKKCEREMEKQVASDLVDE